MNFFKYKPKPKPRVEESLSPEQLERMELIKEVAQKFRNAKLSKQYENVPLVEPESVTADETHSIGSSVINKLPAPDEDWDSYKMALWSNQSQL